MVGWIVFGFIGFVLVAMFIWAMQEQWRMNSPEGKFDRLQMWQETFKKWDREKATGRVSAQEQKRRDAHRAEVIQGAAGAREDIINREAQKADAKRQQAEMANEADEKGRKLEPRRRAKQWFARHSSYLEGELSHDRFETMLATELAEVRTEAELWAAYAKLLADYEPKVHKAKFDAERKAEKAEQERVMADDDAAEILYDIAQLEKHGAPAGEIEHLKKKLRKIRGGKPASVSAKEVM